MININWAVPADARGDVDSVRKTVLQAFGESQILCAAVLYVPGFADQFPLRSAFIKALHARFADEGISFPYPQRVVHMAEE